MMKPFEWTVRLPDWVGEMADRLPGPMPDMTDRMGFVVALSRQNIRHQTGGPFGAAVFDETGRLVAPGVNLVTSANCSILHAEIVAIALAQKTLGRYDISDGGKYRFELIASTEPCAMCFGAIPWSGIRSLVCGARSQDAEAVGFDEGPKPGDWKTALHLRGIAVQRDVMREEAAAVLREYMSAGGRIYNAG